MSREIWRSSPNLTEALPSGHKLLFFPREHKTVCYPQKVDLLSICASQKLRLKMSEPAVLTYFEGRGRAEVIRIALALAKIPVSDTHQGVLGPVHTGGVSRFARKIACKSFDVACNCLQCCVNTSIGNNVFHFLRVTFASTSASCVNGG